MDAGGHHKERSPLERKPIQAQAYRPSQDEVQNQPEVFSYFSEYIPIFAPVQFALDFVTCT